MLNVIWLILNSSIQYGDILSNGIKLQPFLLKKKMPMLIAAEEATGLVNYSHISSSTNNSLNRFCNLLQRLG